MPATFVVTGDSRREQIVKNIKTTLEGITEANGYGMSVAFVDREQSAEINRPAWPNIIIVEGEETAERKLLGTDTSGTKWMKLLRLMLSGAVEVRETLNQECNQLLAAMELALMVDTKRGGLAIDTRLVGNRQYLTEDGQPIGAVDLEIEIHYRHDFNNPFLNS